MPPNVLDGSMGFPDDEDGSNGGGESSSSPREGSIRDSAGYNPAVAAAGSPELLLSLGALGATPAFSDFAREADADTALRVYLLDNSGSTAQSGGRVPWGGPGVPGAACSRWDEIRETALAHAQWNLASGTAAEFHLLHPIETRPDGAGGAAATSFVAIRDESSLKQLRKLLDAAPGGANPMVERLNALLATRIEPAAHSAPGCHISVVLITDGVPSTTTDPRGKLAAVLRDLSLLAPVTVTVRLTTTDRDIVEFWESVRDDHRGRSMRLEVLHDLWTEARKVHDAGNSFVVYSPAIHTFREAGSRSRPFELLSEQQLDRVLAHAVAATILGHERLPPPPPRQFTLGDRRRVEAVINAAVSAAPPVFDPLTGGFGPAVDSRKLAVLTGRPGSSWNDRGSCGAGPELMLLLALMVAWTLQSLPAAACFFYLATRPAGIEQVLNGRAPAPASPCKIGRATAGAVGFWLLSGMLPGCKACCLLRWCWWVLLATLLLRAGRLSRCDQESQSRGGCQRARTGSNGLKKGLENSHDRSDRCSRCPFSSWWPKCDHSSPFHSRLHSD